LHFRNFTDLRTRDFLVPGFAGETFDIAPEDFLELGQVPVNAMYCIGGILGSDNLPTPWLLYVQIPLGAFEYLFANQKTRLGNKWRNVLAERIYDLRHHKRSGRVRQTRFGLRIV
jgi:hypothetical protein